MSLYLLIDLASISVPLLVSFHPKFKLHKNWGALFGAIFLTMIPYIIWDVIFTANGYWGFNATYLSGINLINLPIEEWLFFVCIPYACVFTHVAITSISKNVCFSTRITKVLSVSLAGVLLFSSLLFYDQWYTLINALFALVVLGLTMRYNFGLLRTYFLTFLVMLVPFFLVNGILTGSFIPDQVVWYNNQENLGIRIGTIPVEDTIYAFSLILLNLLLFEYFKKPNKFFRYRTLNR